MTKLFNPATWLFQNAAARQLLLRAAELEAAEFIREYLRCVEAVSGALSIRRTMDGDQVERSPTPSLRTNNSRNRRSEKFASECLQLTDREPVSKHGSCHRLPVDRRWCGLRQRAFARVVRHLIALP